MMKRMLAVSIATLLLACIQVASVSKADTIDELGQPFPISVKTVYKDANNPNVYKNNVSGNYGSITTKSGIKVTVTTSTGTFESGRLVVREITAEETEAHGWFSNVLKEMGTRILPYDIYFEKNGQRIPLNSKIQITITLPDNYTSPLICHVTTDGKVEVLQSNVTDGRISFETKHTGYYVLAEKIKDSDGNPQTGDNTNLLLYIVLMALSAGILASILIYKYLKKAKT
jgi:hypothetical protein